jgi:tRNA threonylcarbamoyladenosine biosynthesis protein TsaB
MNILGIDSSFLSDTSIGLYFSGTERMELNLRAPLSQEEKLLSAVDTCLNVLNKKTADVDVIAVGTGPGSFTGLRIGISTARGLAWSLKKKMIGLSSLELLVNSLPAELVGPDDLLVPVIDARMDKVFAAVFQANKRLTDDMDISPEDLVELLKEHPHKRCLFFGDGLTKYGKVWNDSRVVQLKDISISGNAVCSMALKYIQENPGFRGNIEDVKPVYLRKSEAEVQADKNN